MPTEVLTGLNVKEGDTAVDLTAGSGGHARLILEAVGSQGRLIAVDRDPDAIKRCQERLRAPRDGVIFKTSSFSRLNTVLLDLGIQSVEGILLDLGVSSEQLDTPERGFSFLRDGPLDMRMDPLSETTAADLVNRLPEGDLADIFWMFGEERKSRFLARKIISARTERAFRTTKELADFVWRVTGRRTRIHPATRIFQALRIAVNRELDELSAALGAAVNWLSPRGRLAVISYHSLEDRMVKQTFTALKKMQVVRWINKKPITPSREEIARNRRSRSAKLRIVERMVS